MPDQAKEFAHLPLADSKASIRPLRIDCDTFLNRRETFCTIQHYNLNNIPTYTALSYMWGSDAPTFKVSLCFEQSATKEYLPFHVRSNLYHFLVEACTSPLLSEAYFWIDQLCIDQSHTAERNNQVDIMDRIYANANSTILWLGRNEFLTSGSNMQIEIPHISIPLQEDSLRYWRHLCHATYWTRLWMVQEICLSHNVKVMEGDVLIDWSTFVNGFVRLNMDDESFSLSERSELIYRFIQVKNMYAEESSLVVEQACFRGLPLPIALEWFNSLQCQDPRDKVFALPSLVVAQDRIDTDYNLDRLKLFHKVTDNLRDHFSSEIDYASFCWLLLQNLELTDNSKLYVSVLDSSCNALKDKIQATEFPSYLKHLQEMSPDLDVMSVAWADVGGRRMQHDFDHYAPSLSHAASLSVYAPGSPSSFSCASPSLASWNELNAISVQRLVDSAVQLIEVVWPLSVLDPAEGCSNAVLPLRIFVEELLKRSRTSFSTLITALYYLIQFKSNVPVNNSPSHKSEAVQSDVALLCGRRMFLAGIILASKQDQNRNDSISAWSSISNLKISEINANEVVFLRAVKPNLRIPVHIHEKWSNLLLQYASIEPLTLNDSEPLMVHDWKALIAGLTPDLNTADVASYELPALTSIKSQDELNKWDDIELAKDTRISVI